MKTTELELERQTVAAATLGADGKSAVRPRYNERVISVRKVDRLMVVVFVSENGNESDQGVRTVILEPKYVGSPGELMWVLQGNTFTRTNFDPQSSGKGHSTPVVEPQVRSHWIAGVSNPGPELAKLRAHAERW